MLIQSLPTRNIYKIEGQLIIQWLLPDNCYIESLESDSLSIVLDTPFDNNSKGFYVVKDLPEHGLMCAIKIPNNEVKSYDGVEIDLDSIL